MIRKLLIANRGEIACRIMRTCRDLGISTIAVFSDADTNALHVELADEAIHIGASPASESYLNIEKLIAAAKKAKADAIHPAYGFLAENAAFAQAVLDAGLVWVGPQPQAIEAMGNKREAKNLLKGIPYVAGYTDKDQSDKKLIAAAKKIGFPIMVKAAAGGGGKGMRRVDSMDSLEEALAAARREAKQAFGDETLMLEQMLVKPRHIEVQIIGDKHGNVMALGERECSIQRRHQKIVEESPASSLDAETRKALHETAVSVGKQLNYENAGTVEFLLDSSGKFYFMEMNTRLQVEHPVTEAVYGIDIVAWQLAIAEGASLFDLTDTLEVSPKGHAVEVRVYAEDPANGFLPVIGDILYWQAPPNVRTDAGIRSGDSISPFYDPMIAKIIAHGANRQQAIRKLEDALGRLQFMGMRNNVAFLRRVLLHESHLKGEVSTQFLDEHPELNADTLSPSPHQLVAAAFAKSGVSSQWRNNPNRPMRQRFAFGETGYEVFISPRLDGYIVRMADVEYTVLLHNNHETQLQISLDGQIQEITVVSGKNDEFWLHSLEGTVCLIWQNPLPLPKLSKLIEGSLTAPMTGQVVKLSVEIGQQVEKGQVLLIMEAMKMEHRIQAPYSGIVEAIRYNVGESVQQDAVLLALKANE
jgi:geranyl-CoA carboxylase alpha subunit